MECTSFLTMRHLLLNRDAIAVVPELVFRDDLGLCLLAVAAGLRAGAAT